MKNSNSLLKDGISRREWRKLCKSLNMAENRVIAAMKTGYEIARNGDRKIAECLRLSNLTATGRAQLPQLP